MKTNMKLTFPELFQDTVRNYGDEVFLSFVDEKLYTYKEADRKITAAISFLEELGVKPGNKVAILSSNMPNWGISYLAVTFMGAVIVPLLPDFKTHEIKNVLNHSESKTLLVSNGLLNKLDEEIKNNLDSIVEVGDFSILKSPRDVSEFNLNANPKRKYEVDEDDVASIIYTS